MRTEKQKMLAGEPYQAADPALALERQQARTLCQELAALLPAETARIQALLARLFGAATDAYVTPPFFCDYGYNIQLGTNVYFNTHCVVLDGMPVSIGDHTMFGPGVHIYTAMHPLDAAQRRAGIEFGRAVTIGHDVWVGGSAVICPGVTIGAGTVVGAGSVVTRSLPPGVFAAGNPCRVLRKLP